MSFKIWIAAAALLGLGAAPFLWSPPGTVIYGMTAGQIPIGGMTRDDLKEMIAEQNTRISQESLTVFHGDIKETWSYRELNVHLETEKLVQQIMGEGQDNHWLSDWWDRWTALVGHRDISLPVQWDDKKLHTRINRMETKYSQGADDGQVEFQQDGSVSFSGGRPYLKISTDELYDRVVRQIRTEMGGAVEIPVAEEAQPALHGEVRRQINAVLASYTTEFPLDHNRNENIRLAASRISRRIVLPGESFSFNSATGLRTKEAGYLEAPVFMDGKLVPDAGGGVCQVSSTLFNAVLEAGLEIDERTCHFAPVGYVAAGRDATVADHYIDFVFRNQLARPVYIYAIYGQGAIQVYILGNRGDIPDHVDIVQTRFTVNPHRTVYHSDPSQKEEKFTEYGHDGYDVMIRRDIIKKGVKKTDEFQSVYDPVDTVISLKDPEEARKMEKLQGETAADKESSGV